MEKYICRAAQKGFYAGPVLALTSPFNNIIKTPANPAKETAKLESAISSLKESVKASSSEENAKVMETVSLMLEDDTFIGEIRKYIADEKCNAEYAIKTKSVQYAKRMEESDSEYLRARASDIDGIGNQLIAIIAKKENLPLTALTALAGIDISPAQFAAFKSEMIGGIITEKGSPNSHLSILAGNLDIPYIYGNEKALEAALQSDYIIIDGDTLIVNPDGKLKADASARMTDLRLEKKRQKSAEAPKCKTKIYANIAGPEDIPELMECGADGVGLFRSEFLFLGRDSAPDEEEQYQAYKSVLEAMEGKEVIIRTMDLGSDKSVRWLKMPDETNPALGLRGVRVSLENKEIFRTQLRALLRAAKC